MNGKIISGPAAITVMLLFFLPWVSKSTNGLVVGKYSGYQLASMSNGSPLLFIIPLAAVFSLFLMTGTLLKPSLEKIINLGLTMAAGLGLVIVLLEWLDIRTQNDSALLLAFWLTTFAMFGMVLGAIFDLFRPKKIQPFSIPSSRKPQTTKGSIPPPLPPRPWDLPKERLPGKATLMENTQPGEGANKTVFEGNLKATFVEGDLKETFVEDSPKSISSTGQTIPDGGKTLHESGLNSRAGQEEKTISTNAGQSAAESSPQVNKTEILDSSSDLRAWLVIDSGHRKGEQFKLLADTTIGRNPNSDILIDDTAMSGLHIRVRLENGRFIAYDQDSTNGLFVLNRGQERWTKSKMVLLHDGTRIKLGRTVLVFMSLNPW